MAAAFHRQDLDKRFLAMTNYQIKMSQLSWIISLHRNSQRKMRYEKLLGMYT